MTPSGKARAACLLAALMLVLVSCTNGKQVAAYYAQRFPQGQLDTGYLNQISSSTARARYYLAGNTARSFSPGHGTQIEYTDTNGNAFLWYPGNSRIVVGKWRTQNRQGNVEVCFLYPQDTLNPVTQEVGGNWECMAAKAAFAFDYERVRGNPFGLKAGSVPVPIARQQNVSFLELRRDFGIVTPILERLPTPRSF
ncbi:hypothetical protein [Ruegeria arenilitoris]|uniref:hypothetical protein n=1 Tax=Ruegeria arenilitoris TaxID=1173585 RepID=UPI001481277D|nr:hypothetical protein [Ruegeria arenilitoris]